MISRMVVPRRKGRRWLTALSTVSILAGVLVLGTPALGLTQSEFELDKNATNDLTTEHLGTLKSSVNSTATSFVVCERQFDITNDGVNNPVVVPIPAVPFTIQIDAEQMTVTALGTPSNKTGGCSFSDPADSAFQVRAWTVTRHVNGTTAASHSGSSDITHMLTGAAPGDDWDQVFASVTADADDIGADDKCIALGAVECAWVHDGFDATVFTTGGSKDDLNINPLAGESGTGWKWTDSSVPPSDEILDAFAAKYIDSSTDHELLFFGADRWSTNGAKDFGFWFFHDQISLNPDGTFSGNHTRPDPGTGARGDILMLGTFSQGGAVTTLRVFEWVGTGGDTNGTLDSLGTFGDCGAGGGSAEGCNTVNNTTVPSPWDYQGAAPGAAADTFYAGALMEGGIDLTELGLEGCFRSFMAETRSSPEPGAQLKDFVLGAFEQCQATVTTTPKDGTGNPLAADTDSDGLDEITIGTGAAGVDVTDSLNLTVEGTNTFTGTLTFFICGPITSGTCDTGGVPAGTINNVTAEGDYSSDPVNLTEVGRYCWRGYFDSNTPNLDDAFDSSTGECFEVLPVQPTLDTVAVDANGDPLTGPVDFGSAVYDKAILSGTAYKPGTDGADTTYPSIEATMDTPANGSITFTLLGPDDCSTLASGTGTNPETGVTVSDDGDYFSSGFTPDTPGLYHWQASYSGDSPNTLGASHNALCDDEEEDVTVRQIPTEIKTQQSWYPNDTATITSSVAGDNLGAGGSVVFELWDSATCDGTLFYTETETLAGGAHSEEVSTSNTTVPISTLYGDSAGTSVSYSWKVTYTPAAGDTAHTGIQSACSAEHFTITYTNDPGPGTDLP